MEVNSLGLPHLGDSTTGFCWEIEGDETTLVDTTGSPQSRSSDLSQTAPEREHRSRTTLRDPIFLNAISSSGNSGVVDDIPNWQASILAIDEKEPNPHIQPAQPAGDVIYDHLTIFNLGPLIQDGQFSSLCNLIKMSRLMPDSTGLYSVFMPAPPGSHTVMPPGKSSVDHKIIEAGYNARIYFRSMRLLPGYPARIVRYKLHGNYHLVKEFTKESSTAARHRDAYLEWTSIFSDDSYHREITPGFEGLAAAFFRGEEIYGLEHYDSKTACSEPADYAGAVDNDLPCAAPLNTTGSGTVEDAELIEELKLGKPYRIARSAGDWNRVLGIVDRDRLLTDGPLSILLRDLIMNNELEHAARKHFTYHGFRIYQQTQAIQEVEKCLDKMLQLDAIHNLDIATPLNQEQFLSFCLHPGFNYNTVGHGMARDSESTNPNTQHSHTAIRYEGKEYVPNASHNNPSVRSEAHSSDVSTSFETYLRDDTSWLNEASTALRNGGQNKGCKDTAKKFKKPNFKRLKPATHKTWEPEEGILAGTTSVSISNNENPVSTDTGPVADLTSPQAPSGNNANHSSALTSGLGYEWKTVKPKSTRKAKDPMLSQPTTRDSGTPGSTEFGPKRSILKSHLVYHQDVSIHDVCQSPKLSNKRKFSIQELGKNRHHKIRQLQNQVPLNHRYGWGTRHVEGPVPVRGTNSTLSTTERFYDPADYPVIGALSSGTDIIGSTAELSTTTHTHENCTKTRHHGQANSGADLEVDQDFYSICDKVEKTDDIEYFSRNEVAEKDGFELDISGAIQRGFNTIQETNMVNLQTPTSAQSVGALSYILQRTPGQDSDTSSENTTDQEVDDTDQPERYNKIYSEIITDPNVSRQSSVHCFRSPVQKRADIIIIQDDSRMQTEERTYLKSFSQGSSSDTTMSPIEQSSRSANHTTSNNTTETTSKNPTHQEYPSLDDGITLQKPYGLSWGHGSANNQLCWRGPYPGRHTQAVDVGNCTYCRSVILLGKETTLVMCPFCSPKSNVRYCAVSCLLVDVIGHCASCMQCPSSQALMKYELPNNFIYEQNPIVALNGLPDPPYRLRQKMFSMYCCSGKFPKLFKTWAKRFQNLSGITNFDMNESIKKTGEYAVFRSSLSGGSSRNNPDADIIFTIKLDKYNPMRQPLNRALNACFLVLDHQIVEFLYRLILHLIIDEEYFDFGKYMEPAHVVHSEFQRQFKEEFGFDAALHASLQGRFDFDIEWRTIGHVLSQLETTNLVLLQWIRP